MNRLPAVAAAALLVLAGAPPRPQTSSGEQRFPVRIYANEK